jgi:hypothetical protein
MFYKLWEENPRILQLQEQLRMEYYEEGKFLGELQAFQWVLTNVIQLKFPDLLDFTQKQVKLWNNPDILELLVHLVLTAPDAKTVKWLLESTPEQ